MSAKKQLSRRSFLQNVSGAALTIGATGIITGAIAASEKPGSAGIFDYEDPLGPIVGMGDSGISGASSAGVLSENNSSGTMERGVPRATGTYQNAPAVETPDENPTHQRPRAERNRAVDLDTNDPVSRVRGRNSRRRVTDQDTGDRPARERREPAETTTDSDATDPVQRRRVR